MSRITPDWAVGIWGDPTTKDFELELTKIGYKPGPDLFEWNKAYTHENIEQIPAGQTWKFKLIQSSKTVVEWNLIKDSQIKSFVKLYKKSDKIYINSYNSKSASDYNSQDEKEVIKLKTLPAWIVGVWNGPEDFELEFSDLGQVKDDTVIKWGVPYTREQLSQLPANATAVNSLITADETVLEWTYTERYENETEYVFFRKLYKENDNVFFNTYRDDIADNYNTEEAIPMIKAN